MVKTVPFLMLAMVAFGCGKAEIKKISNHSKIVAFGDSLTSGYGVDKKESYPYVLSELLGVEVVNAGISGEDTTAGLKRLDAVLAEYEPDLVLLCYGGNDMLQKQPMEQMKGNLKLMLERITASGSEIILIGVPMPNLGLRVPKLYEELADDYDVPYGPDIVKSVIASASLSSSDFIHPNAKGYSRMAELIHSLILESSD